MPAGKPPVSIFGEEMNVSTFLTDKKKFYLCVKANLIY